MAPGKDTEQMSEQADDRQKGAARWVCDGHSWALGTRDRRWQTRSGRKLTLVTEGSKQCFLLKVNGGSSNQSGGK